NRPVIIARPARCCTEPAIRALAGLEQVTVPLIVTAPVDATTESIGSMLAVIVRGTNGTMEPSGEWMLPPLGAQSVGSANVPNTIAKLNELWPPISARGITAVKEV